MKILLIDEDVYILRVLKHIILNRLALAHVMEATDGINAVQQFRIHQPHLVILEVMIPKVDGFGVCQWIRTQSNVPIMMVTGLTQVKDKITAFELGADDYVVKPFCAREIEARIKGLLRRTNQDQSWHLGAIRIHQKQVWKHNQPIRLTEMEWALLELLIRHPGQIVTRQTILKQIWGYAWPNETRVVDVHISRLRAKLEDDPSHPTLILTARGSGYLIS